MRPDFATLRASDGSSDFGARVWHAGDKPLTLVLSRRWCHLIPSLASWIMLFFLPKSSRRQRAHDRVEVRHLSEDVAPDAERDLES